MKKIAQLIALGALLSLPVMAQNSIQTQNMYETPPVDKFYDACNVIEELGLIPSTAYRVIEMETPVEQTCGRVNHTDRFGTERAALIASAGAGKDSRWKTVTLAMSTNKYDYDMPAFIAFREASYRLLAGQVQTNIQKKVIYDSLFTPEFYDEIKRGDYNFSLPFYNKTKAKITHELNKYNGHILVLSMDRE